MPLLREPTLQENGKNNKRKMVDGEQFNAQVGRARHTAEAMIAYAVGQRLPLADSCECCQRNDGKFAARACSRPGILLKLPMGAKGGSVCVFEYGQTWWRLSELSLHETGDLTTFEQEQLEVLVGTSELLNIHFSQLTSDIPNSYSSAVSVGSLHYFAKRSRSVYPTTSLK
jgi:hypothetical protein